MTFVRIRALYCRNNSANMNLCATLNGIQHTHTYLYQWIISISISSQATKLKASKIYDNESIERQSNFLKIWNGYYYLKYSKCRKMKEKMSCKRLKDREETHPKAQTVIETFSEFSNGFFVVHNTEKKINTGGEETEEYKLNTPSSESNRRTVSCLIGEK